MGFIFLFFGSVLSASQLLGLPEINSVNGSDDSTGSPPPISKTTEIAITCGIEFSLIAISILSYFCFRSSFSGSKLGSISVPSNIHRDELSDEGGLEEPLNKEAEGDVPEL